MQDHAIHPQTEHRKAYMKAWEEAHKDQRRARMRELQKQGRANFNAKWKNGFVCQSCGNPKILWHHVDRNTKLFTIDYARANNRSDIEIQNEIKKCIPLCHQCHARTHILQGDAGYRSPLTLEERRAKNRLYRNEWARNDRKLHPEKYHKR